MAISHQLIIVATFVVMFTGSAEAWCKAGFKSCGYNRPNGCETCVATDVNNCGDCHNKCPEYPYTTPTCSNGHCGAKCDDGWKDCNNNLHRDGCEANLKSDANNCGSCGTKCSYGAKCVNGKCESACKPGWRDCNNNGKCEVDCGNDVNNCGSCGTKCSYGAKCVNGKCESACKPGWRDCNNNGKCEVDCGNDVNNCGSCGTKCSYGAKCVNGKCESACKPGWRDCNNNGKCEVDCGNDVNNCGGCGNKCVQPKYYGGETVCSNGKCVKQCKKGMKYDNNKKCCV